MLVTSLCWWLYDGNWFQMLVARHFVSNIRHQHRCSHSMEFLTLIDNSIGRVNDDFFNIIFLFKFFGLSNKKSFSQTFAFWFNFWLQWWIMTWSVSFIAATIGCSCRHFLWFKSLFKFLKFEEWLSLVKVRLYMCLLKLFCSRESQKVWMDPMRQKIIPMKPWFNSKRAT